MIFENMDRIVFAGDSVTDAGSEAPVCDSFFNSLGSGYVRIVENLLSACYPEINLRITNSGISGNTSKDLLDRFKTDVLDLNPDWVSICVGINDVWRQFDNTWNPATWVEPEPYRENLIEMITSLKGKVKGIFLLTPYYMEPLKEDLMRAKMDEYTEICRQLAKEYDLILVDFQEMFDKYFKYKHSAMIAWDRVHPNQKGATLMAREFLKKCNFDYNREI